MAKWNQIVITTAGMNLSAETLSGTQIQYTHAQTTDTDISGMTNDDIKALTSFDSVVQDLNIGTVTVADDHTVKLPVQLTNQDVTADYKLYGIAIFAKPVDGAEILYGVAVATVPDTIEAKGGTTVTGTYFNLKIHVSDSSNVQITVVQTAGVTNEQLDITLKSYTLESELTNKLSKYTATADMPKLIADNIPSNIITQDNAPTLLPANLALTDKANTFTEQQTLAGGAVDGTGNAIATTKDVSDGDATTLKSAKEYADTQVSGKADDSKVVHTADMRKPASDVAGIEEVNAKADDSKVAHLSGANNFDTTPTVNNKSVATTDDVTNAINSLRTELNNNINTAKQAAINQSSTMITAEFTKRNAPSAWWNGTAAQYAAVNPKIATAEYNVYE